jgi:hypothetical protein
VTVEAPVGDRACCIETLSLAARMVSECPYVLALVQGHLLAEQRDIVANVGTGC